MKKDLKCSFETIGKRLAESCSDGAYASATALWLCLQLKHNGHELARLAETVRPFIFS